MDLRNVVLLVLSSILNVKAKSVELVGGSSPSNGRVVLDGYIDGYIGGICTYDGWNNNDNGAIVICRMLGYRYGINAREGFFGRETDHVLTRVKCSGDEETIDDCPKVAALTCSIFEDSAGVFCGNTTLAERLQISLTGGGSSANGRVELNLDGVTGTVYGYASSSGSFDTTEATVVCKSIGFRKGIATPTSFFGEGSGKVLLHLLSCTGSESHVGDCNVQWGAPQDHEKDAGVICYNSTNEFAMQLVNDGSPSTTYMGRVEMIVNGLRGVITDSNWTRQDAMVACRMAGYSNGVATLPSVFGRGNIISLTSSVVCEGLEQTLVDCNSNWGYTVTSSTYGRYDVGVICYSSAFPTTEVHLINGFSNSHGRVELAVDNIRGTIGDSLFDNNDASVICKMADYRHGYAAKKGYFGYSTYNKLFSSGTCTGQESSIFQCGGAWGYVETSLAREGTNAGVLCYNDSSDISLNLVGGSAPSNGRIEINVRGATGTVRMIGIDQQVGKVMCRMLGHRLGLLLYYTVFGTDSSRNLLYTADCQGTETSLVACTTQWGTLDTSQDPAGLVCYNQTSELVANLLNGLGGGNGIFGLNVHGFQFTVIDSPGISEFGRQEARVACRMLGYSGGVPVNSSVFGVSTSPALVNNLDCEGWENTIYDCDGYWGYPWVTYSQKFDVGLLCYSSGSEIVITLVNGGSSSGRVFINFNNVTGTIADSTKDHYLAKGVCKQIGYTSGFAVNNNHYGIGSGPQVLREASCPSDLQTSIADCSGKWGPGPTRGPADFGVICYNNTSEISVTLSGGSGRHLGKVIISAGGTSGYVASSAGSSNSAKVLCRMAGFSYGFVFEQNIFPSGADRLLVTSLSCSTGLERSLADCDVALGSSIGPTSTMTALCLNDSSVFSIDLLEGFAASNGRVNVIVDGRRGSISADWFWDNRDADVICKMLRYSKGFAADRTVFAQGGEAIIVRNLQCTGSENSLHECDLSWTSYSNGYDAGVICFNESTLFGVELVGGGGPSNGRVMITVDGVRGAVLGDSGWDAGDATVVCKTAGHKYGAKPSPAIFSAGSEKVLITDLGCTGTENTVRDCEMLWSASTTQPRAAAICFDGPSDFSISLEDGYGGSSGRVVVAIDGLRGNVADDSSWDNRDASVFCRMKEYRTGFATHRNMFPQGFDSVIMAAIECSGYETSIVDCGSYSWSTYNENAGVICVNQSSDFHFNFRDGSSSSNGRVELTIGGLTSSVDDSNWNTNDATVVCRTAGYRYGIATDGSVFPIGSETIRVEDFACTGSEDSVFDCNIDFSLMSGFRAGIICYNDLSNLEGVVTVRLIDGNNNSTGRVEIVFPSGVTTGVSTTGWDNNDARVICWMLGFKNGITRSYGSRNNQYYYFTSIGCLGTEKSILECPFTGIHSQIQFFSYLGGVECSDPVLQTTTTSSTSKSTTSTTTAKTTTATTTTTTKKPSTTTTITTKEPTITTTKERTTTTEESETTTTTKKPTTISTTMKPTTTSTITETTTTTTSTEPKTITPTKQPTTVTTTKKPTTTTATKKPTTTTGTKEPTTTIITTTNKPTTTVISTTKESTTTTTTTTTEPITTTAKEPTTTAPKEHKTTTSEPTTTTTTEPTTTTTTTTTKQPTTITTTKEPTTTTTTKEPTTVTTTKHPSTTTATTEPTTTTSTKKPITTTVEDEGIAAANFLNLDTGQLIGTAVGLVLFGVLLTIAIGVFITYRRKKKKNRSRLYRESIMIGSTGNTAMDDPTYNAMNTSIGSPNFDNPIYSSDN